MSCADHTYVYVKGEGWVRKSELMLRCVCESSAPMTNKAYSKELKSRALSVHRVQAKDYNEMAKSRGITGVRWADDGTCYFSSRRGRNDWMRATGRMDMDAGYGDHAGR